jgi:hypothetical protein
MATIFGVHHLEARPGVQPEEIERFLLDEILPAMRRAPGLKLYVLRGDRGERDGSYALLYVLDSVAVRDGFVPDSGEYSQALYGAVPNLDALGATADALFTSTFTDYVDINTKE